MAYFSKGPAMFVLSHYPGYALPQRPWDVFQIIAEVFGQWERLAQEMLRALQPEAPVHLRQGEVVFQATPKKLLGLQQLSTQFTLVDGVYLGPRMTDRLTRRAARHSGDFNQVHVGTPHPMFRCRIAHGMHGVSLGLGALRLALGSQELVPAQVAIRFRQPLKLGQHTVAIEVAKLADESSPVYTVSIFAQDRSGTRTLATVMTVTLAMGYWTDDDWTAALVACWQISAALAETWPLCLYVGQELRFASTGAPLQEVVTRVQGIEADDRGRIQVDTSAGSDGTPFAWGNAIILPRLG